MPKDVTRGSDLRRLFRRLDMRALGAANDERLNTAVAVHTGMALIGIDYSGK
jgi:hypothetical protein